MSEPIRILYPDVLSRDKHAVERAVADDTVAFEIFNEKDADKIPDDVWRGVHGMVTGIGMPLGADVIARLETCKIITRLGVGYDLIDTAAAGARGIVVCNVPDYGTNEVSDHAFALILNFTRGIALYNETFRDDPKDGWNYLVSPTTVRMAGKRFGVIGLGRMGTASAMRAKGFGMDVVAFDPFIPDGQELALAVERVDTVEALLGTTDFVTIHTPLDDTTRNLINAKTVAAMKPGLILVNTARGEICDLDAIYDGLKSRQLGACGLDVLPDEPADPDHKLIKAWRAQEDWIRGRFVITPHAAFYSPAGLKYLREKALLTCVNYIRDGVLKNCVNADFLKR